MPLPYADDLNKLDAVVDGAPDITASLSATNDTNKLDFIVDGAPLIGQNGGLTLVAFAETVDLSDSLILDFIVPLDEGIDLGDAIDPSVVVSFDETVALSDEVVVPEVVVAFEENAGVTDETLVNTTVLIDEAVDLSDEGDHAYLLEMDEGVALSDELATQVLVSFEETADLQDSFQPSVVVPEEVGVGLSEDFTLIVDFDKTDTVRLQIIVDFDITDSVDLEVTAPTIVPVTDAADPLNVLEPTVIINGEYVFQNGGTDPGGDISDVLEYIRLSNIVTGVTQICRVYRLSLELDYEGGTFSMNLDTDIGDEGDTLTLLGLPAYITRAGERLSSGQQGYTYRGLIGYPVMNKQLVFQGFSTNLQKIIPSQRLVISGSDKWTSVRTAFSAIMKTAGLTSTWTVRDFPLTDFTQETGMPVIDALRSLVARAGAVMRFNGVGYDVVYPDQASFSFMIPRCELIGPDGIGYERIKDVETGVTGTGMQVLPRSLVFDSSKEPIPEPLREPPVGTQPTVTRLTNITKFLTRDDAPITFDLPVDYDKVYIQTLCPHFVNGSLPTIVGTNFCTLDPTVWVELTQYAGYVNWANIGGVFVPQVLVNWTLFPEENSDVSGGHFTMALAYTRKARVAAADTEAEARERESAGFNQEVFRFVRTYEGSVQSLFYGALAMPGMGLGTVANTEGISSITDPLCLGPDGDPDYPTQSQVCVSGIIETVSLNIPGYMNLGIVNFARLGMNTPYRNITAQFLIG